MTSSPARPALILASGSRYRREMLARLGLAFDVDPADIDEAPRADEGGQVLALRLARDKAAAVASRHPGQLVLGCDQVAECRGRLLGKPGTSERAVEQLVFTAGHEIVFHSALCLRHERAEQAVSVPTRVKMRPLDLAQIERYVELEQPLDCAGAMKSECLGIALAESIESRDPTALIGLPLITLCSLLQRFGLDPLGGTEQALEKPDSSC